MGDNLWRWWEEQAAPNEDDLHPRGPGGCFPLTILLLAALVVGVVGAGAATIGRWV